MLRPVLLIVFFNIICVSARNPFSVKQKKVFKKCFLKGVIIGEKSFAYLKYDDADLTLGVGEEVAGLIITEIDCENVILKDHKGKTWKLEVDKFMKIGE